MSTNVDSCSLYRSLGDEYPTYGNPNECPLSKAVDLRLLALKSLSKKPINPSCAMCSNVCFTLMGLLPLPFSTNSDPSCWANIVLSTESGRSHSPVGANWHRLRYHGIDRSCCSRLLIVMRLSSVSRLR